MKKLVCFICVLALLATCAFSFVGCNNKVDIGIIQFGTHASLNNCYEGIIKGLKENGIDTSKYKIQLVNDNFDADASQSHAKSLVNKNAKVIVGIATPSAIAAATASNGQIPVVYCAVTDDSMMNSFSNTCGSSDRPNYDKTLELITAFMGKENLKIGVISCTSEASDEIMISDLTTATAKYDGMTIDLKRINADSINTISTVVNRLIDDGVDCFLNLLDNTIVGQLETILEITNGHKIPVFGSEVEQVVNGCMAASSIDYIEIGRIAGEMAAKIIKGEAKASELGGRIISAPQSYYNEKVVNNLLKQIPDLDDLKSITEYRK